MGDPCRYSVQLAPGKLRLSTKQGSSPSSVDDGSPSLGGAYGPGMRRTAALETTAHQDGHSRACADGDFIQMALFDFVATDKRQRGAFVDATPAALADHWAAEGPVHGTAAPKMATTTSTTEHGRTQAEGQEQRFHNFSTEEYCTRYFPAGVWGMGEQAQPVPANNISADAELAFQPGYSEMADSGSTGISAHDSVVRRLLNRCSPGTDYEGPQDSAGSAFSQQCEVGLADAGVGSNKRSSPDVLASARPVQRRPAQPKEVKRAKKAVAARRYREDKNAHMRFLEEQNKMLSDRVAQLEQQLRELPQC